LDLGLLLLALSTNNFSAMTKTAFADTAPLMSPRTAKYVEAMIREGDNFDYNKWLKRVRGEEAQAKQAEATGTSVELATAEKDKPMSTPGDQHRLNPALRLMTKTIPVSIALRGLHRQAKSQTPKARLRRWLEKVLVPGTSFKQIVPETRCTSIWRPFLPL
jgi:hypothetical protein